MFTISSLLCGLSWSIGSIIAFRALQGFTGGAMVPLVFAVGFTLFSGKQRALIRPSSAPSASWRRRLALRRAD
jgi:DHA2 family multidrug resistance protein